MEHHPTSSNLWSATAGDLGRVWKTAPSKLREVDHAFLSRTGGRCDVKIWLKGLIGTQT